MIYRTIYCDLKSPEFPLRRQIPTSITFRLFTLVALFKGYLIIADTNKLPRSANGESCFPQATTINTLIICIHNRPI